MQKLTYIDNTMLSAYHSCPRKFYYRHVRHLIQASTASGSPALEFGKAIHNAMEELYRDTSRPHSTLLDDAYAAFKADYNTELEDSKRNLGNALNIIAGYIDKWFPEHFTVTHVESATSVELSDDLIFCGKIDLIVDYPLLGGPIICEHKTTSNMSWFIPKPNHQIAGYIYIANVLGHRVKGAIVNLIGVFKTKTDYHRIITTRTPECLEEWRHMVLDTKLSIDRDLERGWFRKQTTGCYLCPYQGLCKSTSVRSLEAMISSNYVEEKWEPWKQRGEG